LAQGFLFGKEVIQLAITKQRKTELVAEYTEQLKQSKGVIVADYRGLSVGDISDLRNSMRPIGGRFQVVKNRLMLLALEEVEISLPKEWFIGPTAISFCHDEVPPVAKILTGASKDLETLRIKGGMVERSVLDATQVHAIADLPSREVLLGQALGTINAPATQVTGAIASGIRQVLNVLQAYVDALQESGAAPAAEPA
jgi:large subunit ribosomal protein L10